MDVCECVAEENVQELVSVTTVGISSKTVTMYGYVADDLYTFICISCKVQVCSHISST